MMRTTSSLLLVLALAFAGCDSDPSDADGGGGGGLDGSRPGGDGGTMPSDAGFDAGDPGLPIEMLPGESARVFCDTAFRCLGAFSGLFGTPASCMDSFTLSFTNENLAQWQAAIARGTVVYDGNAAEDCLAVARTCQIITDPSPPECEAILSGTIAVGTGCSISEECMGDAYCAAANCPDTAGTCTARLAAGSPCSDNDECQSGLQCDGTCGPRMATRGMRCADQSGCALDEICVGADDGAGSCLERASIETASLGAACELQGESMVLCNGGARCAITAVRFPATAVQECVAEVASGSPCNAAVPSMCPLGEWCAGADPMRGRVDGTCTALPESGQPCVTTLVGEACAVGAACVDGTCRQAQANGATCTVTEECHSSRCAGGMCASPELCAM